MANKTQAFAHTVRGTNPQFLISLIVRNKIYDSPYWKAKCFGLSAATILDEAINIQFVGGTYGGRRKSCQFLALLLKLLQIGPSDDIVQEYINQDDYKYLRCLGAIYLRMTGKPSVVYKTLERHLDDYRKVRLRALDGSFSVVHVDEWMDMLLREKNVIDVDLPPLTKRDLLEKAGEVGSKDELLEDELELDEEEEEEEEEEQEEEDGVKENTVSSEPAIQENDSEPEVLEAEPEEGEILENEK